MSYCVTEFFTDEIETAHTELDDMFTTAYQATYTNNKDVFTNLYTKFKKYYTGDDIDIQQVVVQVRSLSLYVYVPCYTVLYVPETLHYFHMYMYV